MAARSEWRGDDECYAIDRSATAAGPARGAEPPPIEPAPGGEAGARAVVGWSVLDRLGAIEAPVLVVASERDYWPVAAKEAYARRMQRAEVTEPRQGRRTRTPLKRPTQEDTEHERAIKPVRR